MKRLRPLVVVLLVSAGLFVAPPPASAVAGPHLSTLTTFQGRGGYSADGLGQYGTGGPVEAEVPPGSAVEAAYLYGSYFDVDPATAGELTIDFDGTNVPLTEIAQINTLPSGPGTFFLTTARADVTGQVAAKVGSGSTAPIAFSINNDPTHLDGVALVVIYSNPAAASTSISIVDGAADPAGQSASVSFPPFPAGGAAQMSLGIGFSYQGGTGTGTHECGTGSQQSSLLDVNVSGQRLTSCAGNYDDGADDQTDALPGGALITVGGVGDTVDNPSDPFQQPGDGSEPRVSDDELYDLAPFLDAGDTSLSLHTSNPSFNDNLFLAVVQTATSADVSVTKSDTPPPGDSSFGPDPVGSGDVVVYKVVVSNDGPDPAHEVTVTDAPDKGQLLVDGSQATSPGWSCTFMAPIEGPGPGSIQCVLETVLQVGSSAELRIWLRAPTTTTNETITDTVSVTATETDPNPTDNTAIETTTVIGSGTAAARDQDATFCDGESYCTVQTARDTVGRFYSKIVAPPGFDGLLSIREVAANSSEPGVATLCGGSNCQYQVQISSLPDGTTSPNTPFVVTLFYVKDSKQTSRLWVQGDNETAGSVVENCLQRGVANPPKCVNTKMVLKNGDRAFEMLWTNGGDPISGKR